MMKKLILTSLAAAAALAAAGQATARSALNTLPSSVAQELPQSKILDMIDYYDSGVKRPTDNIFGNTCVLDTLANDIAVIKTGEDKRLDICVLPKAKGEELIMIVESINTPAPDASIRFFNTKWEPIAQNRLFPAPKLNDWLSGKIDADRRVALENAIPFILYDADYNPSTRILTLTRSDGAYIAQENKELVEASLLPELIYRWDGKKFIPAKR